MARREGGGGIADQAGAVRMTEMVERVTNILMNEFESSVDEYYSANEKYEILASMEAVARNIIATLREPTKAMLAAKMSLGGYGYGDGECYCADPREVWQAMIDEALKP